MLLRLAVAGSSGEDAGLDPREDFHRGVRPGCLLTHRVVEAGDGYGLSSWGAGGPTLPCRHVTLWYLVTAWAEEPLMCVPHRGQSWAPGEAPPYGHWEPSGGAVVDEGLGALKEQPTEQWLPSRTPRAWGLWSENSLARTEPWAAELGMDLQTQSFLI